MKQTNMKYILTGVLAGSMILLSGCGSSTPRDEESVVPETRPLNWYVRPVVKIEGTDMQAVSARLGQVERDASSKTLRAMKPYVSRYVDVVFVDPAGVEKGVYQTSFQPVTPEYREARWQFEVKVGAEDANADLSLGIKGVYVLTPQTDENTLPVRYSEVRSRSNPILSVMYLKDVETGVCAHAIEHGELLSYNFNMQGKTTRIFEWLLDANISKECTSLAPVTSHKKVIGSSRSIKTGTLDLSHPPKGERYK